MVTIKITCVCGQKYAFDVEPYNGRMPGAIQCPICKTDGTEAANLVLAQSLPPQPASPIAVPIPSAPGDGSIRIGGLPPTSQPTSTLGVRLSTPPPETLLPPQLGGIGHSQDGLLSRNIFFVKERVGLLKLTDAYDILDPATQQPIGIAKEEPPTWAKWLRLAVAKHKLPTAVNIYEQDGTPPVVTIKRGFTFLRQKIRVTTGSGQSLGYFKSKLISIGGGFHVYDDHDQQIAEVKGNWKGWDFKLLSKSGREIGTVTKKWAGLGRELFTSADNYVISITDPGSAGPNASALLLAAGLAIDIVFKEDN